MRTEAFPPRAPLSGEFFSPKGPVGRALIPFRAGALAQCVRRTEPFRLALRSPGMYPLDGAFRLQLPRRLDGLGLYLIRHFSPGSEAHDGTLAAVGSLFSRAALRLYSVASGHCPERMAEDYGCRQGNMPVTELAANGYRVTGCGYTATYDCSSGRYGSFTCVKEAGSSPVPALALPEDVGARGIWPSAFRGKNG
jgi:hypothetical protein